jgi:hypothetical protein
VRRNRFEPFAGAFTNAAVARFLAWATPEATVYSRPSR